MFFIKSYCIFLLFMTIQSLVGSHDLKGFDDTVLFNLEWHGKDELLTNLKGNEELFMTTTNKEKYRCIIPSVTSKESESDVQYNGPSPLDLIIPLFNMFRCSHRIESYWTYEICHGNYIKQYHEEKLEKSTKMQEYFLGRWDKQMTEDFKAKLEKTDDGEGEKLKYKKIDGLSLPYLELEMGSGTVCDLNGEPRVTRVLYVCYTHGNNEIFSLKETSSCNYEVVILTQILCSHPKYKPQDSGENKINCVALDKSPKKPKNLLAMEVESMKLRYQKLSAMHKTAKVAMAAIKFNNKEGPVKVELFQNDLPIKFENIYDQRILFGTSSEIEEKSSEIVKKTVKSSKDTKPVYDFLDGTHCLTGGSGWWKFEFCYGKYVRQFHDDTTIFLGYFNEEKHKDWLLKNPKAKARSGDNQIINFYADGDICEKTMQARQVEVKLKCTENSSSPSAVALYLLEPKPCEYILNVESSLICEIAPLADEFMLVPAESKVDDGDSSKTLYILGNNVNN